MLATTEPTSDALLNERDKREIQKLLWAFKPIADLGPPTPLPYALAYLAVPLEEGRSVGEYARGFGVDRITMHRYLNGVADRAHSGAKGHGLVAFESTGAGLKSRVRLTEKGRALLPQILRGLKKRAPWLPLDRTDRSAAMSKEDIDTAWERAAWPGNKKNSDAWRRDKAGNLIRKGSYGSQGKYGWEIAHGRPVAKRQMRSRTQSPGSP